MQEKSEDKIESIIKRLEKLETEVSQIKDTIYPYRQNIKTEPPPTVSPKKQDKRGQIFTIDKIVWE